MGSWLAHGHPTHHQPLHLEQTEPPVLGLRPVTPLQWLTAAGLHSPAWPEAQQDPAASPSSAALQARVLLTSQHPVCSPVCSRVLSPCLRGVQVGVTAGQGAP